MRLSDAERHAVLTAVRSLDPNARLWLFGSRVDDNKKGGDIDIAILSSHLKRRDMMRLRRLILDDIGDQKLDLVLASSSADPFFALAIQTGVPLNA